MMHCETSSETTSHRDSLSLINHSLVSLQFKQDSLKFTVSLSKRKSWPMWTIKDNGAESYLNFREGFLPRTSSQLCSGADKREVLCQDDDVGDLILSPLQAALFRVWGHRVNPRRGRRREDGVSGGDFEGQ